MSQIGNCTTTEIRSYDISPKQTENSSVVSKTKMRPKFTSWSDSFKVSEIICGITVQ